MKTKVSNFNAIICFIIVVFFCILACDNGSVSDSSSVASNGLVKVSLSVGEKTSAGMQKSISVNSDIVLGSLIYKYNAVPQWVGSNIYGAADWTTINYSDGMSLGYFTPGLWKFGVRLIKIVDGNEVIVYEGYSGVESISTSSVAINIAISKIVEQAAKSVTISVTAPTVDGETLSISYTGTASSVQPIPANIAGRANGLTTFEYSFSEETIALDSGNYTFTLSHPLGGSGAAVAIELRPGEQVQITGHIDNGVWQVGCVTVKVHEITKNFEGCNYQINVNSAAAGDKVSFYIEPFAGNILQGTVNVTWTGGSIGELVPVNGLYTFTMPDADVTIHAIYSGVNPAINVAHFMAIMKILFDSNPGVTYFGPSADPPSNGVEYFEVKNMKLWCQNHQILWYTSTHSVTFQAGSMINLFKDQSTLATIDLRGFNTAAVTNMAGMFQNCSALTSLTFDNEKDADGGYVHFDTSSVEDMSHMFNGCIALTSLAVSGFKTGNVESMAGMFRGCEGLTSIVLDSKKVNGKYFNFDTSSVTDMSYMFCCKTIESGNVKPSAMSLVTLDVSGLDTSKVTNMSYMFYMCWQLSGLNVSGFRTPRVTDMSCMFACYNYTPVECPGSLTELDLRGWDFTNVISTAKMFDRQELLNTGLQFPPETTNFASLTNLNYMFSQCRSLSPEHLRTIILTWKFSGRGEGWQTSVYGDNNTSLFGKYRNTSTDPNFIIRDTMLSGQTYHNFAVRQKYKTADYVIDSETGVKTYFYLYVGGTKDTSNSKNCELTIKPGDYQE